MKIKGKDFQSIWLDKSNPAIVKVIDQRKLPFEIKITGLRTKEQVYSAISDMTVRGAPLIGVTAAYGMYLALLNFKGNDIDSCLTETAAYFKSSRPTAVNLAFAVDGLVEAVQGKPREEAIETSRNFADSLKQKELDDSFKIGEAGLPLLREIYSQKRDTVNILTHCNAGWLACIDWGTATAPIYKACREGIPVHVWVDETRPRNQGARLTAFELGEEGVPHTVIADNTGGHLMQHGMVDIVLIGSDRTTVTGDVANKIGTYLKALAAYDNKVPFYAALPSSSIDWTIEDGITRIPIEKRNPEEVSTIEGWNGTRTVKVSLIPGKSEAANYGFDVTPARLVTGLITERGICRAASQSILTLFPEKKNL